MITKQNYHSPKIGFVSLGCPKAGSDSEKMLSKIKAEGYEIAQNYHDSELVIVNTCGFIDSAVEESLDAISEAIDKNGNYGSYSIHQGFNFALHLSGENKIHDAKSFIILVEKLKTFLVDSFSK